MKRSNIRYTNYEDNIILEEIKSGPGYVKRIAEKLTRSESSVRCRIKHLRNIHLVKSVKKEGIDIYLITTTGCQACAIQSRILDIFNIKHNNEFKIFKSNFLDVPTFIKLNVNMSDYPITVIVKDNTIKYNFEGTKSIRELEQIFKDLKL